MSTTTTQATIESIDYQRRSVWVRTETGVARYGFQAARRQFGFDL